MAHLNAVVAKLNYGHSVVWTAAINRQVTRELSTKKHEQTAKFFFAGECAIP